MGLDEQLAAARETANRLGGRTELLNACASLDVGAVESLIERGEDAGKADKFGRTPMHEAARFAYKDEASAIRIVTALLEAGAEIDPAEKEQGLTPLMEAAIYKSLPILKLLIERGANVNHKGKDRKTVLGVLTANTSMMRGSAKVIKVLEEAGATGRKK